MTGSHWYWYVSLCGVCRGRGTHQQGLGLTRGRGLGSPLQYQVGQPLVPLLALLGPGDGDGSAEGGGQHGAGAVGGRGGQLTGQDTPARHWRWRPRPPGTLLCRGWLVAVLPAAVPELLMIDLVLETGHSSHVEWLRRLLQSSLEERMLLLQSHDWTRHCGGGRGRALLSLHVLHFVLHAGPGAGTEAGVCTMGPLSLGTVDATV